MKRYQLIPKTIEAIQWDGVMSDEIMPFVLRSSSILRCYSLNETLKIVRAIEKDTAITENVTMHCDVRMGEYIVYMDNDIYVYPPDLFTRTFTEMDNQMIGV